MSTGKNRTSMWRRTTLSNRARRWRRVVSVAKPDTRLSDCEVELALCVLDEGLSKAQIAAKYNSTVERVAEALERAACKLARKSERRSG